MLLNKTGLCAVVAGRLLSSHDDAVLLLARLRSLLDDDSFDCLVKDILETSLRERRALHVRDGADLASQIHALAAGDGRLALALQTLHRVLVLAQIDLGAHQNHLGARAVV